MAKKTSRTIIPLGQNFSYAYGDQSFQWSPDSKWKAAHDSKGYYNADEIVRLEVKNGHEKGQDVIE